jgi:L-lactate dehydrogenase complex protein LldG
MIDTSEARRAIFARIRKSQGRSAQPTADERHAVQDYLRRHPQGPRPDLGNELLLRFKQQAARMFDTIDEVPSSAEAPAAVARYLDGIGIPRNAIGWGTLRELPWTQAGVALDFRLPANADQVGITGCFCAVAETGTLLLLSGAETFASASLLPETHVAIVQASRIVGAMEDAFELARKERGELPRATNFISGPSRTADIEQTIVLGAHGPYRVHVIIVNGE